MEPDHLLNRSDTTGELAGLPRRLFAACNEGDARGFAAPFLDEADFVEFDGTYLQGRDRIEAYHQPLFDTVLRGWHIAGDVLGLRTLGSDHAIVRTATTTVLPGQVAPSPGRASRQLIVARRAGGTWVIEALQNGRALALDRQQLLDDLDALDPAEQAEIAALAATRARR